MIKYTIPEIGQGCCVEQVAYLNCEKHRILYDCGSDNIYALGNYIDTIDTGIPTTLVISHLHRDHINGIPYLLERFKKNKNKIKQLYLPAYYPEVITLFAMYIVETGTDNTFEEDNELIRFIFDLQRNDDFENVTRIMTSGYKNDYNNGEIYHTESKNVVTLESDISWAMKFWVDADIYDMFTEDDNELLRRFQQDDFYIKEKQKDIKKVYQKVVNNLKVNFNRTSMLMASYLKPKSMPFFICLTLSEYNCTRDYFNRGFVCTGDYPFGNQLKCKEIHNHYSDQQILISNMMVPHHGSGNKACEYVPFDFIKRAYAQNGVKNKYKHPSRDVINFLEDLGIEFINVQNRI